MEKICSITGCEKKTKAKGWCTLHLDRFYSHGNPLITLRKTICETPNCNKKHFSKGFCQDHYNEQRRLLGYPKLKSRLPNYRLKTSIRLAKKRNLDWNIDLTDYKVLINKKCDYCSSNLPETSIGLDRKDNSKGYLIDNVVPCCTFCNSFKSNKFTYEEFKEFSKTDLFLRIRKRFV